MSKKIQPSPNQTDSTNLNLQINIGGAGKEAGLLQINNSFAPIFRLLFIDTDKKRSGAFAQMDEVFNE